MTEALSPILFFAMACGVLYAVLYGLYRWLRWPLMLAGAGIARLSVHLAVLWFAGSWLAGAGARFAQADDAADIVTVAFPLVLLVLLGAWAGARIIAAVAYDVFGEGHRRVEEGGDDQA